MADKYLECGMDAEIITFVPMTESEVKKRGFNQAELLANEVGKRLDMAVLPALVKIKSTSEQKQLKGKDRALNLEGAFACVFEQVKGRKFCLSTIFYDGRDGKRVCKYSSQSEGKRSERAYGGGYAAENTRRMTMND